VGIHHALRLVPATIGLLVFAGVATVMKSLALLFVSRIGAGIAGATIPTAQAYIADSTSLEKRPKGMALIGMAFGLGFTSKAATRRRRCLFTSAFSRYALPMLTSA